LNWRLGGPQRRSGRGGGGDDDDDDDNNNNNNNNNLSWDIWTSSCNFLISGVELVYASIINIMDQMVVSLICIRNAA
jgi:hypothetical protein